MCLRQNCSLCQCQSATRGGCTCCMLWNQSWEASALHTMGMGHLLCCTITASLHAVSRVSWVPQKGRLRRRKEAVVTALSDNEVQHHRRHRQRLKACAREQSHDMQIFQCRRSSTVPGFHEKKLCKSACGTRDLKRGWNTPGAQALAGLAVEGAPHVRPAVLWHLQVTPFWLWSPLMFRE